MIPDAVQAGKEALRQGRLQEAIQLFEGYLAQSRQQDKALGIPADSSDGEALEAQMNLVRAYHQLGQTEKARSLCLELLQHPNPQAQGWAKKILLRLPTATESLAAPSAKPVEPRSAPPEEPSPGAGSLSTRQRAAQLGMKIPLPERAGPLHWAKWGSLGVGIVFLWWLSFVLVGSHLDFGRLSFPRQLWFLQGLLPWLRNGLRWLVAGSLAVNFGVGLLFFAPWLMDQLHQRLHKLRWARLGEIERYSPETARLLQRICAQNQLKQPRLGVIPDAGPLAFVYGTFSDGCRIVVTQALLQQLSEDEIAAVYAQALGRIVNGDILVMTLLGSPIQLVYLALEQVSQLGSKRRDLIGHVAPLLYLIYTVLSYPLFFLSRLGTYHADHFAVEATGNPNGLIAALLKSAAGLQEAHKNDRRPSSLLHCTRLFSFLDFKTIAAASAAARLQDPSQAGQVFLWDQINPWARWMQVNSSHPLPGHRFKVLAGYGERLRLLPELSLGSGSKLDVARLQSRFWLDLAIYAAEVVGILIGWLVGLILYLLLQNRLDPKVIAAAAVVGYGVGLWAKAGLMYGGSLPARPTDVLSLLADPDADPRRGQWVELEGELVGLGPSGYQLGAELKLQEATGLIPVRFTSPLGPVGNVFSGLKRIRALVGRRVKVVGWFRRGNTAWVDLAYVQVGSNKLHSRPRLWLVVFGLGVILLGIWGAFYFPNLASYLRRW
ncbi:putative peptidase [Synechococcus sp. JA-2-3B'a(2-13)]|uniref:zinc metalloprotease HtpX n=1 Tax=Synechococcus sp. (strain JA-2-3B'a(2-13)) TaxID=321332 RepID=UPI00006951DE|nr:zinc metalloprotease HtpX [Synechococcus sp. JA-2-3B'a(2-13)]ABD03202.1 putative peptidase [Synechococcus sp. JA-2-3B'a(2-13)]